MRSIVAEIEIRNNNNDEFVIKRLRWLIVICNDFVFNPYLEEFLAFGALNDGRHVFDSRLWELPVSKRVKSRTGHAWHHLQNSRVSFSVFAFSLFFLFSSSFDFLIYNANIIILLVPVLPPIMYLPICD